MDALKACLLLNLEPTLDAANAAAATAALQAIDLVVVMSPFKSAAIDVADVLLPIAPFSETSGTFVNAEGRAQSFHGVVKPLGCDIAASRHWGYLILHGHNGTASTAVAASHNRVTIESGLPLHTWRSLPTCCGCRQAQPCAARCPPIQR